MCNQLPHACRESIEQYGRHTRHRKPWDPPVATVEFSDGEKTLEELQKVVTKEAGDYTLKA